MGKLLGHIKTLEELEEWIPELEDRGFTLSKYRKTVPPLDWVRVFIVDQSGVTLGRVTFHHGVHYSCKVYSGYLGRPLGSGSHKNLVKLFSKNNVTEEHYDFMMALAKEIAHQIYVTNKEWRKDNPKPEGKKRSALVLRNPSHIFKELLRQYLEGEAFVYHVPHTKHLDGWDYELTDALGLTVLPPKIYETGNQK